MKFNISFEAKMDLEKIWLYTYENWSIDQADRYINLIMDEMEYITQNPHIGKDYTIVRKRYFRSRIKSHFIFYRIKKERNEVEIIRVLHQRMDIDTILDE